MKIGSLIYATNQGLGILAKEFYDNGVLSDVLILRHSSRETHHSWYPENTPVIPYKPFPISFVREFIRKMDVMLFFETPFNWDLIEVCRQERVLSVLMTMYECMPEKLPIRPDRILCPSHLDASYYPDGIYLPVPAHSKIKWGKREKSVRFLHNAGHGGLNQRNGTGELVDAFRHVKSPVDLVIRTQRHLQWDVSHEPRIHILKGNFPHEQLYEGFDVFVFPEKFNGLSLPLQEAYASGMLVMGTNRFPMTSWLPEKPLIPVLGFREEVRLAGRLNPFNEAVIDPLDIAHTIDEWYDKDISEYSERGRQWAEENSWEKLKPKYLEAMK